MSIDCAFFGFLAADADLRTSKAGKPWTRLRVGVGRDDNVQWLNVACFGKAAEAAATFKKSDRVYVEGAIKLDTWRGDDGVERHSLSVTTFKIDQTHKIGRHRERKAAEASGGMLPFDDEVPFSPEWRG